ncbi:preprotein translocase subunit SecG [Nocardiopsis exhalans]
MSIPPLRGRATGERVILGLSIFVMLLSVLLILLVLMHKGKGGGLSDMFGGGVTSSLGGSSVVERNLDRMTVVVAVVWILTIVVLGLLINRGM